MKRNRIVRNERFEGGKIGMQKMNRKVKAIFMVMLMALVFGGTTGLLAPGGNKAYAALAAIPITGTNIASVLTNNDHTTVTLTTNVYMAPLTDVSVTAAVYVQRTESGGFVSIAADSADNTVTVVPDSDTNQTVFTLTFATPLTGAVNEIQIQGQYFKSQAGVVYTDNATTQPLDIQPPAYVGSNSNYGNNVDLNFDENFTLNNGNTNDVVAFLRSQMKIATDGVNFVDLPGLMDVSYASKKISLNYSNNDMKVILGANTRIKIASGTFMDALGNLNADMNLNITPPVIQSATINEDHTTVTITFNKSVSDNYTPNCECTLKDKISLLKDGANSSGTSLSAGDEVTIVDGKLVIKFAQALVGEHNQILITGNALKDDAGNVLSNNTTTPFIVAGEADTTAPKLLNYYLSSHSSIDPTTTLTTNLTDLTFVFNEDVVNNMSSPVNLLSGIRVYDYTRWPYPLVNGLLDSVSFSANTVTIHFNTALTGNLYHFDFNSNLLKDTAGNILKDIYSLNIYPNNSLRSYGENISHNGRLLNFYFSNDIADNTIVDGTSSLKDKIKVSTDQGLTFSHLASDDIVTIQGYRLVVLFHDTKKSGTIQVQLEAGAVSDLHNHSQVNTAINDVIAYNTPDVNGYFFSNAASEFVFEDDAVWRSKVRDVMVFDDGYGAGRTLNSSEYTLTAGKLTINKGVFQEGMYYYVYIDAEGYSSKEIDGSAFTSSHLFYKTAPVISTQGGILATVNILRNNNIYINSSYGSTQTVVFELFNGDTPVSIIASESNVYTGNYSAQFNVPDAVTNHNYSVRAFVVNKFTNDYTNVGVNLTTEVTQDEFDLKLNDYYQNG
jgi:hypothetical protein